ncbi:MAG: glycosyl transferase family 1 [Candidatus Edwardsbacteria bacterium RIFOXYD12_FULL_50_11]|uniref:Glycosyl transferase family 1 n=1 Tax=Candidatus Edwardsbacteria bacterium GWF2_54_11 TaxID=1817851 RepID=A0A1F5RH23_9BACT|nr:MAG: glycosyl transferase family 1 [Candidatus Edwardsbacteria bacterium RifOxyC12_full_54_24]OGF06605.1 MAG: glycosyl transferase family 1 [Candidatus Edwardsbacteria bacterium RifOxyA12_full_54_48]OGF11692.1 MAG: glycosyl transferase family 1 [Candidatus Edwardsbacteria bacterium GWE2_54_12]OGF13453.1 MAG: glycosyl transferase family 1 [Candidatus Edwardsbacteria bacterium GWF2_54_11]OGF17922.1 MAG: glycosyl transferase family 1 [Candidatus Edwardsbacteria bacterium RIFOXYD12_FULL_50_11]O
MALAKLDDYRQVVGDPEIEEMRAIARQLKGARMKHINSTSVGGGVAEILHRMVPLLNEMGILARWEVIKGGDDFFNITKAFHNALHGKPENITPEMFRVFADYNRKNAEEMDFSQDDFVFIHDPQSICLIEKRNQSKAHWVWRCHIDISTPQPDLWQFLKNYVERYEGAVISSPSFSQRLSVPQFLIPPSIDPLADKNRELDPRYIESVFEKYHIDRQRPIVTQISRFDRLKDPVGLIKAFKMAHKKLDCQLVLAGGGATDDPEGLLVLEEVKAEAEGSPDIHILHLAPGADLEINALVRGSSIIVQNSIKEGFGLTVSEALWKGKAIISRPVGGITQQVLHDVTGLLVHSTEGLAYSIRYLLANPDWARALGKAGKEFVRGNFLITRHLRRYMLVMLSTRFSGQKEIYL